MKTINKKELEKVLEKWFNNDIIGIKGTGYVGTEEKNKLYKRLDKLWKN